MNPTITHYDGTSDYPVLIAFLYGEDLGGWPNGNHMTFMTALRDQLLDTIGHDEDWHDIEIEDVDALEMDGTSHPR
tara:strand:+ start:183 stop:410 length:228 start_codon:yes stop_codon:yes gene_type:complete